MCRSPRDGSKMRVVVEQEITQERAAIAEALTAAEARLVELEAVNSALEAERLLAADWARVAQQAAAAATPQPETAAEQTPTETAVADPVDRVAEEEKEEAEKGSTFA